MQKIDDIVEDIQKQISNSMVQEISSKEIGEMVMNRLAQVDEVAYVRFASVYRQFADLQSFMKELKKLKSEIK